MPRSGRVRPCDERLEVGVLQAGPVLPGLAPDHALLSLAVTLVFALPMLPALLESGADLARILMRTPSLPLTALPWVQFDPAAPVNLWWLKPYQTVTFAAFYQARVTQSTQPPTGGGSR